MVRLSADEFLTKVAALYDAPPVEGRKGTVAISCKSGSAEAIEEQTLLFRAAKYGNNKHKIKYSAMISSKRHGTFHAQLSHLIKTKADGRSRVVGPKRPAKGKKATE